MRTVDVPDQVEKLARAMCAALDFEPDKKFQHGANFKIYPRIDRHPFMATKGSLHYSPNWHQFVWLAHKWIFEHSGGALPATQPVKTESEG